MFLIIFSKNCTLTGCILEIIWYNRFVVYGRRLMLSEEPSCKLMKHQKI